MAGATQEQRERWAQDLEDLLQAELSNTSSVLHKVYKAMLDLLLADLRDYVERYGDLSFSKRLEVERLLKTAKQISATLADQYAVVGQHITEYATTSGLAGYAGVWYAMENVENFRVASMGLDRRYVEAAVAQPVAGKTLSQRLYRDRDKLARTVQREIVRGVLEGRSYSVIAARVAESTQVAYRSAHRIAQTEGGRVRTIATQRAYKDAVESGVYLSKRWVSTLDLKTRPDHRFLDGQTVAWDGDFTALNGEHAQGPRLFASARLSVRCRCSTEPVVDGAAAEIRRDNVTGEDIEYQTFSQWFAAKV